TVVYLFVAKVYLATCRYVCSDDFTLSRLPSFPTRRSSDLSGRSDLRASGRRMGVRGAWPSGRRSRSRCPSHRLDGRARQRRTRQDRKSTRLNSSHVKISYAVFCLKKKNRSQGVPCKFRSCI